MSTGFSVPSSGDAQRSLVRLVSSRSSRPEEKDIEAGNASPTRQVAGSRRAGRQAGGFRAPALPLLGCTTLGKSYSLPRFLIPLL